MRPQPCRSFVTVSGARVVHCIKQAGHGPGDDIHHGLLVVILPDGREHAASLVWSTSESPVDADNLRRAD